MITPAEADKLASAAVNRYVNACGCKTQQDVANVLMKLVSMSGLAITAVAGQKNAVDILQGTTDYIARPANGGKWYRATVN